MMARIFMKSDNRFSIDDAFQEEMDEIKSFTTTEKSPLKPKSLDLIDNHNHNQNGINGLVGNNNDTNINIENNNINQQNVMLNGLNPNNMSYNVLHQYKSKYEDSISRDSDSYVQNYSNIFDDSSWCCAHPKVKENWKLVLGAALLFFVGTGLIVSGIVAVFTDGISILQGVVFFVVGTICFIPGAYHIVYIYLAVKGHQGYDFYHLPLFN